MILYVYIMYPTPTCGNRLKYWRTHSRVTQSLVLMESPSIQISHFLRAHDDTSTPAIHFFRIPLADQESSWHGSEKKSVSANVCLVVNHPFLGGYSRFYAIRAMLVFLKDVPCKWSLNIHKTYQPCSNSKWDGQIYVVKVGQWCDVSHSEKNWPGETFMRDHRDPIRSAIATLHALKIHEDGHTTEFHSLLHMHTQAQSAQCM